jgi:hypothetical protein
MLFLTEINNRIYRSYPAVQKYGLIIVLPFEGRVPELFKFIFPATRGLYHLSKTEILLSTPDMMINSVSSEQQYDTPSPCRLLNLHISLCREHSSQGSLDGVESQEAELERLPFQHGLRQLLSVTYQAVIRHESHQLLGLQKKNKITVLQ